MDTMLLAVDTWDLCLDASGNIARASVPYALAQDVASALRTFIAEVWYDDTLGIPYFQKILGKSPPITVFQALMEQTALTAVPKTADVYVVSATCIIQSFSVATRVITGQVQFTDSNGQTGTVSI